MRNPPETRNAPSANRRVVAGTFLKPDSHQDNRAIRDPQRRVALLLSRRYSLRLGVALVVADALVAP